MQSQLRSSVVFPVRRCYNLIEVYRFANPSDAQQLERLFSSSTSL